MRYLHIWLIAFPLLFSCHSKDKKLNYNELLWYEYPAEFWSSLISHFKQDRSAALPVCYAELLLKSLVGEIHLLQTLIQELNAACILNLKGKGVYNNYMEWKNGVLVKVETRCPSEVKSPVISLKEEIISPNEYPNINIKQI